MFKFIKSLAQKVVNFFKSIFAKKSDKVVAKEEAPKTEETTKEELSPEVKQSHEEFLKNNPMPGESTNGLDYVSVEFRKYLGANARASRYDIDTIMRTHFNRGVTLEKVSARMEVLRDIFNMKVVESLTTGIEECLGHDGINTIEQHAMAIETGYKKALKNCLKGATKHMAKHFYQRNKFQINRIISDIVAHSYVKDA